jgi:nucleoporin NUP82
MPKVLSRTPEWLSHGAPGHSLFAANPQRKQLNGTRKVAPSLPFKTIVHRGTEVFVAVDNEIRWSDLVFLQEVGQTTNDRPDVYKVGSYSSSTPDHIF